MTALKVMIVEDSPTMVEAIRRLVIVADRTELVATHATEDDALADCGRLAIDVAVIDLQLAQGTGFGVIRRLREQPRRVCCVIVITAHAVPALKVAAFEAGADYFLDKSRDMRELARIVGELDSAGRQIA